MSTWTRAATEAATEDAESTGPLARCAIALARSCPPLSEAETRHHVEHALGRTLPDAVWWRVADQLGFA